MYWECWYCYFDRLSLFPWQWLFNISNLWGFRFYFILKFIGLHKQSTVSVSCFWCWQSCNNNSTYAVLSLFTKQRCGIVFKQKYHEELYLLVPSLSIYSVLKYVKIIAQCFEIWHKFPNLLFLIISLNYWASDSKGGTVGHCLRKCLVLV